MAYMVIYWYITEKSSALAFLDESITVESKRKNVEAIKANGGTATCCKRLQVRAKENQKISKKNIKDFIFKKVTIFF